MEDLPGILSASVKEGSPRPRSPHHFRHEQDQYFADEPLSELAVLGQNELGLALIITKTDLFSLGLHFVFGIATLGWALIFTIRLRPEPWGMPHNRSFHWRILTKGTHELGHAFGLPHCEYPGCVMYSFCQDRG